MLHDDDRRFCDHEKALREAEAARDTLAQTLIRTYYPAFHVCAPAGWINDPNGLVHYDGRYHVYYQHNPRESVWGPMHWGHVSSTDLVHWCDEPMALAPSIEADREGCWSGSSVVGPDGTLHVFYTGHRWHTDSSTRGRHHELQCLATSTDAINLKKLGVVVDNPAHLLNYRDPKVFAHNGVWYMVLGQETSDHRGQIALFRSRDLSAWEAAGILYECPEQSVYMLECPDLFPIGDYWVLVFSKMYRRDLDAPVPENHCGYVVGTWKPGAPLKVLRDFRRMDAGHNYYAPQSFETPDGRRVSFGWVRPHPVVTPEQKHGWSGQLTLPRELTLTDDLALCQSPIAAVADLFDTPQCLGPIRLVSDGTLGVSGDLRLQTLTVEVDVASSSPTAAFEARVANAQDDGALRVFWSKEKGCVSVDRGTLGRGHTDVRSVTIDGDRLKIQLFLDRSLLEVYVNDGESVFTELVYPSEGPLACTFTATSGSVDFHDISVACLTEDIWQNR